MPLGPRAVLLSKHFSQPQCCTERYLPLLSSTLGSLSPMYIGLKLCSWPQPDEVSDHLLLLYGGNLDPPATGLETVPLWTTENTTVVRAWLSITSTAELLNLGLVELEIVASMAVMKYSSSCGKFLSSLSSNTGQRSKRLNPNVHPLDMQTGPSQTSFVCTVMCSLPFC